MKLFFPLLFLSYPAFAATLSCRANFDESSHYELSKEAGSETNFRYLTDDGIDLSAKLQTKSESLVRGQSVSVNAENESMGVWVTGKYDSVSNSYLGTMKVTFDLEHAEPVELDATCALQ